VKANYKLGFITSRCSGKEPVLCCAVPVLPRRHNWTCEGSFVCLSQSDSCLQNFVGHKISHQINGGWSEIDESSMREMFKIERLKDLQLEVLEKLVDGQDVVLIQLRGSGRESCTARTSNNEQSQYREG